MSGVYKTRIKKEKKINHHCILADKVFFPEEYG